LHANCAYCHRPDDEKVAWMDFRLDTTLKNMGACGVTPMKSTAGGPASSLILKPGTPMESVMWLRMHAPRVDEKTRMPQIATYIVDDPATALVGSWITSITACP
jgi:mono/diheme cytochrome c family protein